MATITVEELPAEAAPRPAATDPRGRKIALRKINALDRLRLFELVGAENSRNEPYLGYASLAYHVASIDGDAVAKPASKAQLEALIQRLDDDGLNAVAAALPGLYPDASGSEELLKNASGTPAS